MKATRVILLGVLTVYCVVAAQGHQYESDINENAFSNDHEGSGDASESIEDGGLLTKLIGGRKVSIQKYPYTAAVIQKTRHFGSAVVLNKKWLLTTAWVIFTENPKLTLVRVGSSSAIDKGQISWVELNITHPDYRQTYGDDVGLIKLATPIKFDKNVKAIRLAQKTPAPRIQATLTSFGLSETNKPEGNVTYTSIHDGWLRALSMKTMSNSRCKDYYQHSRLFSSKNYCLNPSSSAGPCSYDYGSPLVYKGQLIGLFSGLPGCTSSEYPPVITDVSLYTKWINNVIKKHSTSEELKDIYEDIEYY